MITAQSMDIVDTSSSHTLMLIAVMALNWRESGVEVSRGQSGSLTGGVNVSPAADGRHQEGEGEGAGEDGEAGAHRHQEEGIRGGEEGQRRQR